MTNLNENHELTQQLVREYFEYKDGKLYWKKSNSHRSISGKIAGGIFLCKNEYRYRLRLNGKYYYASRIIFLYHHGYLPETVDHIDRDSTNDKIENLRAASKAENCRNRTSLKNSTSQYLGVHLKKSESHHTTKQNEKKHYINFRWASIINVSGKRIILGYFKNENDAALAFNKAAVKYYGEFANLNIIKP